MVEPLEVQTLAEPYVTAASLRLSQQRDEEADALLQKVRGWCNGSAVTGGVAEVRTVRPDSPARAAARAAGVRRGEQLR